MCEMGITSLTCLKYIHTSGNYRLIVGIRAALEIFSYYAPGLDCYICVTYDLESVLLTVDSSF